jgi:NAD(P)H-flavin reductase
VALAFAIRYFFKKR